MVSAMLLLLADMSEYIWSTYRTLDLRNSGVKG